MTKRALIIAINYTGTAQKLNGCVNDSKNVKVFLMSRGFTDIVHITDETGSLKPTHDIILSQMLSFAKKGVPGDLLAFFYSGHGGHAGSSRVDTDGICECIYAVDLTPVKDEEIFSHLIAPVVAGVRLYLHFDSCHSGSVANLPYRHIIAETREIKATATKPSEFIPRSLPFFSSSMWKCFASPELPLSRSIVDSKVMVVSDLTDPRSAKIAATVMMISGCKDCQTSADDFYEIDATRKIRSRGMEAEGAMTHYFFQSLTLYKESSPTFYDILRCTAIALQQFGYSQTPQLSSSSDTVDITREKFWL